MYTDFFGLRESPFNSTMDTRFFFPSPQHEEALASLVYAGQQHKGLTVVTGDVGTGKTFVAQMLTSRLGSAADVASISHGHLLGSELLQSICREFQVSFDPSYNTMELLAGLEEFLLTQRTRERLSVLVIDDAHSLEDKHFEQLRLINNLEVSGGKLILIVLLGQPDLNNRLQKIAFRQLRQRIFRSFHIPALSRDLTQRYVEYRLRAVGADKNHIFEDAALDIIHQYSNGIPRLINNLCDNLLLSAFSDGSKTVDGPRVNQVIDELMGSAQTPAGKLQNSSQDEVERAITEITSQYVQSLENQISHLETTGTETDQRIHELHRLSAKLQAQELKFAEHQAAIDTKTRDLHRLTITLQEYQDSLGQREKGLAEKIETLNSLYHNLENLEKRLNDRHAKSAQQFKDLERLTSLLTEQDDKLTTRATFIEKKLADRQVSFDRELNDCKRSINRKWQEMKQLVENFEARDLERSRKVAVLDQRLMNFDKLANDAQKLESSLTGICQKIQVAHSAANLSVDQLEHLVQTAGSLLSQPQVILENSSRQMVQVERLAAIVQKTSDSLEKTVQKSLETSKKINNETLTTQRRIEELEDNAVSVMNELEEKSTKTFKLRDIYHQIHVRCETQVATLKSLLLDAEKIMAKVPRQVEELKANVEHPDRLMKELRTIGSVAERNLHDGQVRLAELRSMIDKAENARVSIEALINATRRVADNRRNAPKVAPLLNGISGEGTATPRRNDALGQKIETLADAIRKARSSSTGGFQAPESSEISESAPGAVKTGE